MPSVKYSCTDTIDHVDLVISLAQGYTQHATTLTGPGLLLIHSVNGLMGKGPRATVFCLTLTKFWEILTQHDLTDILFLTLSRPLETAIRRLSTVLLMLHPRNIRLHFFQSTNTHTHTLNVLCQPKKPNLAWCQTSFLKFCPTRCNLSCSDRTWSTQVAWYIYSLHKGDRHFDLDDSTAPLRHALKS